MSRYRRGYQKVWKRDGASFLWAWSAQPFYPGIDDLDMTLHRLERCWREGGNYGALADALRIITEQRVVCGWATQAAVDTIASSTRSTAAAAWWKRYVTRDLPNVARALEFEHARDPVDGPGLSRKEATHFAAESLRGTIAQSTPAAIEKLVTRMKGEEARAFGRYYLCAGTTTWENRHIRRKTTGQFTELIVKWRHRAAMRGNERMRLIEEADKAYVAKCRDAINKEPGDATTKKKAAAINKRMIALYDRIQREDKHKP